MFNDTKLEFLKSQLQDGEIYVIPENAPDYAITKFGRVFSTKGKGGKTGYFLDGCIERGRYLTFGIYDKDGKVKNQMAHRLVYQYFGDKPLVRGNVIHHIDFDPHNNRIDNLMWFANQSEHKAYHEAIGHPIGGRPRKNRGDESATNNTEE